MNKAQHALRELHEMDALAAETSPVHRLHPLVKLLTTVMFILTVVSFGKYELSGLMCFLLWPALLFSLSGISVRTCFRKLRFVLPLLLFVGIFNPLLDREPLFRLGFFPVTGGMVSMLTLMLKGILSLSASFLLIATTRIEALCAALRMLHVPKYLVTLLLLTFRYVGVLTEELAVMTDAYALRAPGQKGIHYTAWGSFLGQLLLRSMDRAQELYESMLLRGYHGHFHHADVSPPGTADFLYAFFCSACFLTARIVNIPLLIGSLAA